MSSELKPTARHADARAREDAGVGFAGDGHVRRQGLT
jgi:hypothetical protein